MAIAMPNNIYDADEHRLKFDQCARGKSGWVDPSGRSPGSGSSFGVTQINRMIKKFTTSNYKEDVDETESTIIAEPIM